MAAMRIEQTAHEVGAAAASETSPALRAPPALRARRPQVAATCRDPYLAYRPVTTAAAVVTEKRNKRAHA
jgi:hypothetical protein